MVVPAYRDISLHRRPAVWLGEVVGTGSAQGIMFVLLHVVDGLRVML